MLWNTQELHIASTRNLFLSESREFGCTINICPQRTVAACTNL